jgi:lysyl-tRNA synthetase class I
LSFSDVPALSDMPDDKDTVPKTIPSWPPCSKCRRIMRFIGEEAHETDRTESLHTYQCECGEYLAVPMTRM